MTPAGGIAYLLGQAKDPPLNPVNHTTSVEGLALRARLRFVIAEWHRLLDTAAPAQRKEIEALIARFEAIVNAAHCDAAPV